MPSVLVCPHCRVPLVVAEEVLTCASCGRQYPVDDGIADFAEGRYYDSFAEGDHLSGHHLEGLALEVEGSIRRMRDFYAPLIRRSVRSAHRVLDCGCGNGVSVDELITQGFDTFGNDVSQLRKWQWRERRNRSKLVVASGMGLPFPDRFFDVVISSGVLEHIGVEEAALPTYTVRAQPDRDEQRRAFLRELARVTRPSGSIFLDFPNGSFPVDFWHGDGTPRWNRRSEGFLPTFREVQGLSRDAMSGRRIRAHAPYRRLQFGQASRHWYGQAFRMPVNGFFRAMTMRPLRWLASTALNPFLVIQISTPPLTPTSRTSQRGS